MMGIAQSMVAGQVAVGLPAVVHEGADKGPQQAKGIEGLFTPIRVNTHPGQTGGGQHLQPVKLTRHAQAGLIRMGDRRGADGLADGPDRGFEPLAGLL